MALFPLILCFILCIHVSKERRLYVAYMHLEKGYRVDRNTMERVRDVWCKLNLLYGIISLYAGEDCVSVCRQECLV